MPPLGRWSWARSRWSWALAVVMGGRDGHGRSLWHDGLGGGGQVRNEFALVLVKPYLALRVRAGGELAWLQVPERPGAVADLDLPDTGPLLGEAGPHRDAQFDGDGRGVEVARYRQRAGARAGGGQDAPGHRLAALGPAPVRADDSRERDQFQGPARGALGPPGQVRDAHPSSPAPPP